MAIYLRITIDSKRAEMATGLKCKRQKTNTQNKIPLLRPALLLAKKYTKDPRCQAAGKVFPVSSNQKMNAYLKEIADVCKSTRFLPTTLPGILLPLMIDIESQLFLSAILKKKHSRKRYRLMGN